MRSLRPSQVRARIFREHLALQDQLDRIEAHTLRAQAGELEHTRLLELARSLYRDLREHIDFEDALLGPALRDADAWGAVRADELERHHSEQRHSLRVLAEQSECEATEQLAQTLTSVITALRVDMAHENRDLLSSDLLRDDLIALDASGG